MEFDIHRQILLAAFAMAVLLGAVAHKTNFCTMGAVSDWVNMGDTGRLRAWLLAIAVASGGVLILEAMGKISLAGTTFPPYRTVNFAWLRYLLGGAMFGIGMTLASGCGNKTLVRVGGGNLKSLVVLIVACLAAYAMMWTDFYADVFDVWMASLTINLGRIGADSQAIDAILAAALGVPGSAAHWLIGGGMVLALLAFIFAARDFRRDRDNLIGGSVVGLAVVGGWYVTAGAMGTAWKEWAEMADTPPSRVATQSFTFVSPMGDVVRYLTHPGDFSLINFGIAALAGIVVGSFLYAVGSRRFRIEWFASRGDFLNHVGGGALMGIGGVLAMGCTIGQGVTGISTLALGSILTFVAIVAGAAMTMKFQYWRLAQAV